MKKKTDNLFSELPCCAKDFIELVIKKMRYRKKVRADVMAELAAHFEDELRDCKSDEEKQQRAEQLIEEFGDVKLLATLLRRAKRRCRPLWRAIVARTFQTVGVLILCLIVYVGWFLSGKPVITTNYVAEMNRATKPVINVDPNLNAAPFYYQAAELFEQMEENEEIPKDFGKLFSEKYTDLTDEQKQFADKWLEENAKLLELIVEGTQKPYYWLEYKTGSKEHATEAIAVLLPHLYSYRQLAKTIVNWQVYKKAEMGQLQPVLNDLLICYRFGQHLKGDKTLIEQLVGVGIEAMAVKTIHDVLSEYEIDSTILDKLSSDFEQLTKNEDFVMSFEMGRMCLYDEVQRCFTVDRIGGGHLYIKRVSRFGECGDGATPRDGFKPVVVGLFKVLFTHPNKQETLSEVNDFYGYFKQMAQESPALRRAENIDMNSESEKLIKKNLFLKFLAPALGKITELSYRIKADVQATSIVIAILRYKKDNGDYPENLEQLVKSGYLKELPIDPWSEEPLIYKKTEDDFMLYSVGLNFIDDGGEVFRNKKGKVRQWADEGDAVFLPVQN
ncbi:MAG: hypothetical protein KAQ89_00700 [Planctomycetes bacterium]|nr:hypothetical protein [Planctomycetota bacterium]